MRVPYFDRKNKLFGVCIMLCYDFKICYYYYYDCKISSSSFSFFYVFKIYEIIDCNLVTTCHNVNDTKTNNINRIKIVSRVANVVYICPIKCLLRFVAVFNFKNMKTK